MNMISDIKKLGDILGHAFASPETLKLALTHPSAAKTSRSGDNQRLEFLGDRVLGLIIAEMLYQNFNQEAEGALAKRLAYLVRQERLADIAKNIDLGSYLILSRGEHDAGGRTNPAILADACESVIGALYLDGGLEAARGFIVRYWKDLMHAELDPPQDSKTSLQEWAQGNSLPLPKYVLLETKGPAHDPLFKVEVSLPGFSGVSAEGRSKRQAEQLAASLLLEKVKHK